MTTTTMTNQERITAALVAIGFEQLEPWPLCDRYFHDGSGITLSVWTDENGGHPVSVDIDDPNWPAIPAVMTQVAAIVSPTLAINTVKEAASE